MQRDLGAVLDISLACSDIEEFVAGYTEEQFLADKRTRAAVIHQITVVGEAVKRLSSEFKAEHPEVPWKAIAGMRDALIHGYDEIDLAKVWHVATIEVPALREQLEPLVREED